MPDKQFLNQLADLETVDPVSICACLNPQMELKNLGDEDSLRITSQY